MAFVNSVSVAAQTSPVTTGTVDMATGGANVLIAILGGSWTTNQVADGEITDSSGNTYLPLGPWFIDGANQLRVFVARNVVTSTTMTFTATWTNSFNNPTDFFVAGYSGRSGFIGTQGQTTATSHTSHTLSQFGPTISGSDYFAAILLGAGRTITAGSGWTVVQGINQGLNFQTRNNVSSIVQDSFTVPITTTARDWMVEILPAGYLGGSVGLPKATKPPLTLRKHPSSMGRYPRPLGPGIPIAAVAMMFVSNASAPQLYDHTLPAQLFQPLTGAAPAPPAPIHLTGNANAPQLWDSTLAAQLFPSTVAGSPPPIAAFVSNGFEPQRLDLTLASQLWEPTPTRQGPVPPLTAGAPQLDLTPPSASFKPTPVRQGPVPPLTAGAPQSLDLTLASWVIPAAPTALAPPLPLRSLYAAPQLLDFTPGSTLFPSAPTRQGPVPPLVGAPPSVDLQLASWVFQAVPSALAPLPLRSLSAAPQFADLTPAPVLFPSAPTRQGPVPPLFIGTPQLDLTPPSLLFRPTPTRQGPVPPLVGESGPPRLDLTPPSLLTQAAPTTPPPAALPLRGLYAAPQPVDLTLGATLFQPTPTRQGPVPPQTSTAGAPQSFDLTLASWIFSPTAAAPLPLRSLYAAPQLGDFFLPARIFPSAPTRQGPVPALIENALAPQSVDLTLASWVIRAAPTGLAPLRSLSAAPQLVDLTLNAALFQPTPTRQGPVPALVGAAPFVDLTPVPLVFQTFVTPPVTVSVTIGTIVVHPQDLAQFSVAGSGWFTPAASPTVGAPPTLHLINLGLTLFRLGGTIR